MSQRLRENGSSRGKAKYRCSDCGYQAIFAPAAPQRAVQYAQVIKLLVERHSQRSVIRVTGVARMTIARWIKKAVTETVEPETAVLELDEMWTFVAKRKRKVWLWLAVERAMQRIVGWVLGCRGAATGRRLFQALSLRYQNNRTYYTDAWKAYATVLPRAAHRPSAKGSGQTSIVEALNGSLRHRCGVLVRKSCSFSKSLAMHHARIKTCIDNHNKQFTTI